MNYQERKELTQNFFDRVMHTLNKKGNDYANDQDAFNNFTCTALVNGIPVEKIFLCEITKKVSRINELLLKETAVGESIMDSLEDIAGYTCLMENYLRGKANGEGINTKDVQEDRLGRSCEVHQGKGCK